MVRAGIRNVIEISKASIVFLFANLVQFVFAQLHSCLCDQLLGRNHGRIRSR